MRGFQVPGNCVDRARTGCLANQDLFAVNRTSEQSSFTRRLSNSILVTFTFCHRPDRRGARGPENLRGLVPYKTVPCPGQLLSDYSRNQAGVSIPWQIRPSNMVSLRIGVVQVHRITVGGHLGETSRCSSVGDDLTQIARHADFRYLRLQIRFRGGQIIHIASPFSNKVTLFIGV